MLCVQVFCVLHRFSSYLFIYFSQREVLIFCLPKARAIQVALSSTVCPQDETVCVCVWQSGQTGPSNFLVFLFGAVRPVGPAWREHTSPLTHTTHTLLSFFSVTRGRTHEWKSSGVACWRVGVCQAESCICVSKVCARAAHHMFCQTPWSLIPLFCQYFHSIWFHQAEDYTGLDNLPEANMHSFIKKNKKKTNADAHTSPNQPGRSN